MRYATLLSTAFLILITADATLYGQANQKIALVGGMLLDGYEESQPLHHAAILIEGNKIVKVGRATEVEIPPDAKVIDTSGSTMLPGLIDTHVHLTILGHADYNVWDRKYVSRMEEVMEIAAKQLLMAGVTTAAELGGPVKESISIRERIRRGEIPGPRMIVSGPWLIRTRRQIPTHMLYYQRIVDTPEDAAAAAEEFCKAGVDVIKAYSGLTLAHYKAIVDTAHRHGKMVHAHLYRPQNIWDSLKAGVDVLQHAGSAGNYPYEDDLIEEIERRGVAVVPTVAHRIWLYPATIEFPERLQDPQLKRDLPPEMYQDIQESLKNFHTLDYFRTTPRQMVFGPENVKRWIDSGVVLGMGTDSGTPGYFHTDSLWRELKVFVDLGMAPQRVLSAATRINARILGMENEVGTIEEGKLADIIVVKGNPLFTLTRLTQIEHIIKDGVVHR